ncbi:MAG: rRNA maturation RNase YbeY [Bacteroidales bacterium]|jgi:probable rRNA maturation factor|nr:rRNA maturation RNase YbeY [Bacteroidales bacterium]
MKSNISFINNDISFLLKQKKRLKEWIISVILEEEKTPGVISYIFCSDDFLVDINMKYLNSNYLTDIITFDYTEDTIISGDIMISIERVKDNAKTYKTTFHNELLRVIIHGILHLCGYKDKSSTEIKTMREKEDYYINKYVKSSA